MKIDLVRAARLIGLKARVVRGIGWKRLLSIPTPAIVRLNDGSFSIPIARADGRMPHRQSDYQILS
jgi:subfamily B ATP-binding cassette protein HlyB/CyaB